MTETCQRVESLRGFAFTLRVGSPFVHSISESLSVKNACNPPIGTVWACTVGLSIGERARVTCVDDSDCPAELLCVGAGVCVSPRDDCIDSSNSTTRALDDGAPCVTPDGVEGFCVQGLCDESRCGDGFLGDGGNSNSSTQRRGIQGDNGLSLCHRIPKDYS